MKLVIGLGNPGKSYTKTRHNVCFRVLDAFHKQHLASGVSQWQLSKKFNAEVAEETSDGEKILLVKPMTFMNRSGETVGLLMQYYKLSLDDIIVIHDDKDLELGTIKVQRNRGDAGHNGTKSIVEHVGSRDFTRVRCGVLTDAGKKEDTSDFVLGKFGLLERKKVEQLLQQAVEEVEKWLHSFQR